MFRSVLLVLSLAPTLAIGQSSVDILKGNSDNAQKVYDSGTVNAVGADNGKIHDLRSVDVKPIYPGGDKALEDHLLEPATCGKLPPMESCIGSSVMIFDFVVNTDGSVSNVEFMKEGCTVLHSRVVCATQGLSKWQPALLNGVPVRARLRRKVKFDLR
ncbi:MAG: hypothetical protein KA408_03420 [Flavobacteriales bacterium]|nr:hypothetical protein [Flavobacteriales bacterium]